MPQRCGLCGKTEKQHKGKACFDTKGFKRILEQRKAYEKAAENIKAEDASRASLEGK